LPGVLEEGLAYSLGDHAANGAFFTELNLALGRVDVDVDGRGIDLEEKAADGVTPLHEGGMVPFDQGVVEAAVVDWPPVDEEVLLVARGSGSARGTDQPPQPEVAGNGFTEDWSVGIVVAGCFLDLGGEVDVDPLCGSAVELAETVAEGVETLGLGGGRQWG
jgi:hypothetical protein